VKRRRGLNPAKVKADIAALAEPAEGKPFRLRPDLSGRLSVALLCLLSASLLLISFAPFDQWYLAYVALVPWGLAVVAGERGRWTLLWAYLAGVVFWLAGVYWLTWITLPGYLALVGYLGVYWLVVGWLLRRAFRRGLPLWLVLPVLWVALEYARAHALSGFPWFFLAHSQYRRVLLIQVADLVGQYGVSVFVTMVNGVAIEALGQWLLRESSGAGRPVRQVLLGAALSSLACGFLLVYGWVRVGQRTTRPGPRIGVVQQAFPISLFRKSAPPEEVFARHRDNSLPLRGAGCDLVVWPESMLGHAGMDPQRVLALDPLALDPRTGRQFWSAEEQQMIRRYQADVRSLQALLAELRCPLLAGGPMTDPATGLPTNSALLFDRDSAGRICLRGRYDKMHLVPFGESVPFRRSWPALHRLLRRFVPEAMPQLAPGDRPVVFEIARVGKGGGGQCFGVAVPICYEGVFARVCCRLIMRGGRKKADVLVNISNDGWFILATARWTHASTELDQHLAQYVFRAVEFRVPVVRAVNTGISAYIDPTGRIVETVSGYGGRRKMVCGRLVADTVVDERVSLYSLLAEKVGDVFAWVLAAAAGIIVALLLGKRRKAKE